MNNASSHVNRRLTAWLPALLLILVQVLNGLREMPQNTFILIYLQEQLSLAPAAISRLVAGGQLAGMLTALVGGAAAIRLGSRWILAAGLALSGISGLAFQVANPWLAALLMFTGGAGLALVTIGGSSYLTRLNARRALGLLAAVYVLGMTIGGALGGPLAAFLIENFNYPVFSWTLIAIATTAIGVVGLLPPLAEQTQETPTLLSALHNILAITRQPAVLRLAGLRCLPTIFYGVMTVLVPLLLYNLSQSKALVSVYSAATLLVASATQLAAGRAADRWGGRRPGLVGYLAMALAGLGLAATAGTVWGLFAFGILGIAAAWALAMLMYVWVSDGLPRAQHPPAFGLLHAVWSLSMIGGSLLGGGLVGVAPGLPFLLAGLGNLGAFFLLQAYYRARTISLSPPPRDTIHAPRH